MTAPTEWSMTVYLLDSATDDQVELARENAVLSWQHSVTETGLTAVGDPTCTLDPSAHLDSTHQRAWIVTGSVTGP